MYEYASVKAWLIVGLSVRTPMTRGGGAHHRNSRKRNNYRPQSNKLDGVFYETDEDSTGAEENGVYSDEDEAPPQANPPVEAPRSQESPRPRDVLTPATHRSNNGDALDHPDPDHRAQEFSKMSMVQMASYMMRFQEVQDAIQKHNPELFVKICGIIFRYDNGYVIT